MKKIKAQEKLKDLFELHDEIKDLQAERRALEVGLFKNETNYLNAAKGQPITRDCEFYINGKNDKKSDEMNSEDRIFCLKYPGSENFM